MMLPRRGHYDGWEQVAETRQVYEAELMALRLRDAGLHAEVLDQSFRQEPLPAVRSFAVVRLLVPREEAQRARELLAAAAALPPDASDVPELAGPAGPEEERS